jgi:predicted TPR repeat methyltransferase
MHIKHKLSKTIYRPLNSTKAYNLWARTYDSDDDNLVFKFDSEILDSFLSDLDLSGKTILDYGCGTGRNWQRLLSHQPKKIIGCDSSLKMLAKLKNKFPDSETHLINGEIPSFNLEPCDLIISTLVAAQVKDLKKLFAFWFNHLQQDGSLIITDLHPAILSSGGKRTFVVDGKTREVKNYIHTIEDIEKICNSLNLKIVQKIEKNVTEDIKDFYARKNALHIYEKFKGLPLVYGLKIKRVKNNM